MLLQVTDIKVDYDGSHALKGVSVEIPREGIVGLLGPNGAGKSTLIRTITGLKQPTSGEVIFDGKRITRKDPVSIVRLGIRCCPQEKRLFPSMSVIENLLMGGYLRTDHPQMEKELNMVYNLFPRLRERTKQKAGNLSGGEQQMLSIGRALMGKPKLLLLDEPTLGLSPLMVYELANVITSISHSGVGIFLAEQNVAMALGVAKFGYVLELGEILLQGTKAELEGSSKLQSSYLGKEFDISKTL
jgi:branched-chain amino acid transport system ATP-binding protein